VLLCRCVHLGILVAKLWKIEGPSRPLPASSISEWIRNMTSTPRCSSLQGWIYVDDKTALKTPTCDHYLFVYITHPESLLQSQHVCFRVYHQLPPTIPLCLCFLQLWSLPCIREHYAPPAIREAIRESSGMEQRRCTASPQDSHNPN
jgi:hypothetical protein